MGNRQSIKALIWAILLLSMVWGVTTQAQGGGQFCVRAYEDSNGNGQLDAGESLLTYGVGATLHDASGVIINSAILDTSPRSAQGLICFENLAAGQYTIKVTSPEYIATGRDNMTTTIGGSFMMAVLEYSGRRISSGAPTESALTSPQDDKSDNSTRLLVAAGGGLLTMFLVGGIGAVVYVLFLRKPARTYPGHPPKAAAPHEYSRATPDRRR